MKTEDKAKCSNRSLAVGLFLIFLVGGAFRIYQLDLRSVWFDEGFCWRLIQFPVPEMICRTALDNHPPLYFLLLKAWAFVFGDSTFALRMMSVLFGMATIVGTYLMVRSSKVLSLGDSGRVPALIAATMIALSVFQIRWAWDIRMYTLGAALAVFSSAALFRALGRGSFCSWLIYGTLALAFAYTHYYGFFSILAQFLFILSFLLLLSSHPLEPIKRSSQLRSFSLVAILMLVSYLPWIPAFLRQRSQVQKDFWTSEVRINNLTQICYEMIAMPENSDWSEWEGYWAALLCLAILFRLLWKPSPVGLYLFLGALVPLLSSIVISWIDTKVFCLRYFLFAQTFLYAGLGIMLGRIQDIVMRWAAVGIGIICLLAINLDFVDQLDLRNKPGGQGAIRYLEQSRKDHERVIVSSPLLYFSMLHHANNRQNWFVFSRTETIPHYEGSAVLIEGEVVLEKDLVEIPGPSIWVIDMTGWGGRKVPGPENWVLRTEKSFPEVLRIQGEIIVRNYYIRPAKAMAK